MTDLLYYPGFETTNNDWLKFALLYVDRLNPIIPLKGDKQLSPLYRKLLDETDLIHKYRPDFNDGYLSTLDAIDFTERILQRPEAFDMVFGLVNPERNWKAKEKHTFELYENKFSLNWKDFCVAEGLGTKSKNGIKVSETLGNFYMTILANTIGEATSKSIITDRRDLDLMGRFIKSKAPCPAVKVELAEAIVKIKLPKDINKVSIDEIIKIRNSKDFKKHQKGFHVSLENFYKGAEGSLMASDFVDKYDQASNDFFESILSTGLDIVAYLLSAGITLSNPEVTQTEAFKNLILGGGLYLKSKINLDKNWKNTADHKNCRKFLQDLTKV